MTETPHKTAPGRSELSDDVLESVELDARLQSRLSASSSMTSLRSSLSSRGARPSSTPP